MRFSNRRFLTLLAIALVAGCATPGTGTPDELKLFGHTYEKILPADSAFLGTQITPEETTLVIYRYESDEWHSIKGEKVHGYVYFIDKRGTDNGFRRPTRHDQLNWRALFIGSRLGKQGAVRFEKELHVESTQGVVFEKLQHPDDCYAFVILRSPARNEEHGLHYKALGKGIYCGLSRERMIASASNIAIRSP